MNITPAPKNPNINPNHVTPSITLITQNQIPPPAPPPDQTLMSNHPPHVIPTENNQPTRVTPEVSEHSTHVNPTETNHPTSANHPMSAIPMLPPTTYLPSSSLITMSHSNVCVTVSTDNLLPKKSKLPPGHPKAKMTPQEDQEELQESREDVDSFEQSAMDEQRTPITEAPAPIQTQETTTRESERLDTEEHTTPSRAAATAPGHRSENVLNTTPSEGTKREDHKYWPKYVPTQSEEEITPRRPLTRRIPEILNLSKQPLTDTEREVLSLGLRFAPTARKTPDPLEHFERYHDQCLKVYNKLIGTTGASKLPEIVEEHLTAIKQKLEKTTEAQRDTAKSKWLNMSSLHKRTLFALRGDKSRTIKQADKGTCIVVQDNTDYIDQGLKFLRDPEIYLELEEDPSMETATRANELLDKFNRASRLSRYTTEAHKTDLANLREQRMYFLRKVHKTPHKRGL